MTHRLATNYAKNYCNRTLIVKLIVENVVTCFFGGHGVVFTARCTLVQREVLRSHVVCLSVRPSVTLVDCDHIGWNSSKIISRLVSLECSLSADPNIRGLLQWEHPEILAQSDPPLLIERRRHSIANCSRMVTNSATVRESIGNHHHSF